MNRNHREPQQTHESNLRSSYATNSTFKQTMTVQQEEEKYRNEMSQVAIDDDMRSSVDKTIDNVLNKLRNSTNDKLNPNSKCFENLTKKKSSTVQKVTQSLGASLRGALLGQSLMIRNENESPSEETNFRPPTTTNTVTSSVNMESNIGQLQQISTTTKRQPNEQTKENLDLNVDDNYGEFRFERQTTVGTPLDEADFVLSQTHNHISQLNCGATVGNANANGNGNESGQQDRGEVGAALNLINGTNSRKTTEMDEIPTESCGEYERKEEENDLDAEMIYVSRIETFQVREQKTPKEFTWKAPQKPDRGFYSLQNQDAQEETTFQSSLQKSSENFGQSSQLTAQQHAAETNSNLCGVSGGENQNNGSNSLCRMHSPPQPTTISPAPTKDSLMKEMTLLQSNSPNQNDHFCGSILRSGIAPNQPISQNCQKSENSCSKIHHQKEQESTMSLLKTNESLKAKMKELSRELKKSEPNSLKGFGEVRENQPDQLLDQSESLLIGNKKEVDSEFNGLENLVKLSIDRNELKKFTKDSSAADRQQSTTTRESVTSLGRQGYLKASMPDQSPKSTQLPKDTSLQSPTNHTIKEEEDLDEELLIQQSQSEQEHFCDKNQLQQQQASLQIDTELESIPTVDYAQMMQNHQGNDNNTLADLRQKQESNFDTRNTPEDFKQLSSIMHYDSSNCQSISALSMINNQGPPPKKGFQPIPPQTSEFKTSTLQENHQQVQSENQQTAVSSFQQNQMALAALLNNQNRVDHQDFVDKPISFGKDLQKQKAMPELSQDQMQKLGSGPSQNLPQSFGNQNQRPSPQFTTIKVPAAPPLQREKMIKIRTRLGLIDSRLSSSKKGSQIKESSGPNFIKVPIRCVRKSPTKQSIWGDSEQVSQQNDNRQSQFQEKLRATLVKHFSKKQKAVEISNSSMLKQSGLDSSLVQHSSLKPHLECNLSYQRSIIVQSAILRHKIDEEVFLRIQHGEIHDLKLDLLQVLLQVYPKDEEIETLRSSVAEFGIQDLNQALETLQCGQVETFMIKILSQGTDLKAKASILVKILELGPFVNETMQKIAKWIQIQSEIQKSDLFKKIVFASNQVISLMNQESQQKLAKKKSFLDLKSILKLFDVKSTLSSEKSIYHFVLKSVIMEEIEVSNDSQYHMEPLKFWKSISKSLFSDDTLREIKVLTTPDVICGNLMKIQETRDFLENVMQKEFTSDTVVDKNFKASIEDYLDFYQQKVRSELIHFTTQFQEVIKAMSEFFALESSDQLPEMMSVLSKFQKRHSEFLEKTIEKKRRKAKMEESKARIAAIRSPRAKAIESVRQQPVLLKQSGKINSQSRQSDIMKNTRGSAALKRNSIGEQQATFSLIHSQSKERQIGRIKDFTPKTSPKSNSNPNQNSNSSNTNSSSITSSLTQKLKNIKAAKANELVNKTEPKISQNISGTKKGGKSGIGKGILTANSTKLKESKTSPYADFQQISQKQKEFQQQAKIAKEEKRFTSLMKRYASPPLQQSPEIKAGGLKSQRFEYLDGATARTANQTTSIMPKSMKNTNQTLEGNQMSVSPDTKLRKAGVTIYSSQRSSQRSVISGGGLFVSQQIQGKENVEIKENTCFKCHQNMLENKEDIEVQKRGDFGPKLARLAKDQTQKTSTLHSMNQGSKTYQQSYNSQNSGQPVAQIPITSETNQTIHPKVKKMKVGMQQSVNKVSRNNNEQQPYNGNNRHPLADKENDVCNCEWQQKRMTFSIKSHKCTPTRAKKSQQQPLVELRDRDGKFLTTSKKIGGSANTEHSPQPQAAFFKLQDLVSKTATFSSPMTKIERAKILKQPLTTAYNQKSQKTPITMVTSSAFATTSTPNAPMPYGTPKPPTTASGNYASNPTPIRRPSSRQQRKVTCGGDSSTRPKNRHSNCCSSQSQGRRETEVSPNSVPAFTKSTKVLCKGDIQYVVGGGVVASDRYSQKIDTLF